MHTVNLNGRWRLGWCEPGEGERRGWPEQGPSGARLVEASVPGDVHLDLLEAGFIEEPLYGLNARDCGWMEDKDWWYGRHFHVAAEQLGSRSELKFGGLDCTADIWLNGKHVACTDNAHIPHTVDVTDEVAPGDNLLVVRVDAGVRAKQERETAKYTMHTAAEDSPRIWVRKPQFTFSWDWAPRLLTCGIWRSVELNSYAEAALRDICLRTNLQDDGTARVQVIAEVEVFSGQGLEVEVTVALSLEATHALTLSADPEQGAALVEGELIVEEPKLWWPAALGEPALYDVHATLRHEGGLLDQTRFRYGLREIELIQEPLPGDEGESFTIAVNGEQVFCKGANWVPGDSIIARVTPAKYRALVGAASEANFTMLRVWGGGVYEDDAFYDLCDEHGILVWQDFMYACAYYPDDDPAFLAESEREARAAVRRLRNHPCIALWCGNNENQWIHYQRQQQGKAADRCYGMRIYEEVQPRVCQELDPTRPYWPSSPYGGEDPASQLEGNRHGWFVSILAPTLDERTDYSLYERDRAKFMTEFGVLAPPGMDSLRRYLPCDEQQRGSDAWEYHNNRFEQGTNQEALKRYWRPAEHLSLDDYVRFSQVIQAEALKFSLEHWRRRKFLTSGSLFWMYSDCWGEVGWTVIDYYLNRKPSYWAVKRAFAPVLVSFAPGDGSMRPCLVNDTAEAVDAKLTYGWVNVRTGAVDMESRCVHIGRSAASEVATLPLPAGDRNAWMAYGRLERDGAVLSRNRRFLAGFNFNRLDLPVAHVATELSDGEIALRTDHFAWQVHLDAPRGVALEDNDFDMLPGEHRSLALTGPPELVEQVRVRPLNDHAGQFRR